MRVEDKRFVALGCLLKAWEEFIYFDSSSLLLSSSRQLTAAFVAKGLALQKDLVRELHSRDLSSIKTWYARRNTHSNAHVLY